MMICSKAGLRWRPAGRSGLHAGKRNGRETPIVGRARERNLGADQGERDTAVQRERADRGAKLAADSRGQSSRDPYYRLCTPPGGCQGLTFEAERLRRELADGADLMEINVGAECGR